MFCSWQERLPAREADLPLLEFGEASCKSKIFRMFHKHVILTSLYIWVDHGVDGGNLAPPGMYKTL